MKTYLSGIELREGIRKAGERSVWLEVDADLIAAMMGHRFVGPDGLVVSMEQVSLSRAENGVLVAQPVILKQD